ncbi:MAG: Rrf2 family transcriptional regulator [Lentimicrobium sp.]|jgi:Rrf2 family protein|nr:Rrf2 family transcriptional regulator [Lentimicrobium sp.]
MFSKACEYAIRATVHIARQSLQDERASLVDISKAIDSPIAFTAKILQQLVQAGIITSIRGKAGGFYISTSEMKEKLIAEIVEVIDGDDIYTECGLGLKSCSSERPCPAHERFVSIRNDLKTVLKTTSIYSMAVGLKEGLTFLKR